MSLKKLSLLVFAAAVILAVASCKKDDDDMTYPSLSGLYFDCPAFVAPGQVVKMTPKEVEHPEGGKVGYAWKVSPSMSTYDTTDVYVHWFSDTLGTYTVNCYAFAAGYTGTSFSKEVVVVKGGLDGTLTRTGIKASDKKITVDGTDYYYEKIGGLDWFRNNLASKSSGTPYSNLDVMTDVFGRYYNYDEAMKACPQGWRLPTEEDWLSLASALGSPVSEPYSTFTDVASKLFANVYFNDVQILKYWPEVGDITNSSRLSVVPVGYANLGNVNEDGKFPGASFDGGFEYAVFWTADTVPGEDGMAYFRYLFHTQPDMMVGKGDVNTFGASVRCVRDAK